MKIPPPLRMLLLLMGLLAAANTARADCASPAGVAGDMTYSTNSNVMVFCNGTNWISMAGTTAVGVSDARIGTISANKWCVANSSGSGLDCTTDAPTSDVSPSGVSGDVQFNSGGLLAADTGNFTYASSTLSAPSILTGGITATGRASLTTISTSLIQVGNNSAACTSGLAGGVRYNSTSNTMDYCSGSAWLSLGPSATAVPGFSVNKGGTTQTVTAATVTKITWTSEEFDSNNNFTSSRFTPTIPGKYLIIGALQGQVNGANGAILSCIYKNGSLYKSGSIPRAQASGSTLNSNVSAIVDMNGTTDYVELFGYLDGTTIFGNAENTYFTGILISMAGGGSGGTANPAGSASDIQFNSGGLLAADTGNFTYASSTLSAPSILTGGITATGTASLTTVSTSLIQVGTGLGAGCDAAHKGGIRYSNTSSTVEYCNSTAWVSMGPSSTQPIAFSVNKANSAQTVSSGVNTKLTWGTKAFDTNNNFSGDRFSPTVPGKYLIILSGGITSTGNNYITASIMKNAGTASQGVALSNSAGQGIVATTNAIVDMNGTTDYIEGWVNSNITSISGNPAMTFMSGVLLSPQGSGSGGTANPAGSTADIQFNSGGLLAADTGNFTYASSTLAAPAISTGGITATGQASLTTISTSLIQVGNNGASCTSGLAGGVRYNSTSNTIDYCSGSQWLSLGPSATAVPAFLVNRNGTNQTVPAGTFTKLNWTNEVFDTNNNFASDKFTPTIPGKYQFNLVDYCTDNTGYCLAGIYKNGLLVTSSGGNSGSSFGNASIVLDMNGTTDYVEAYARDDGGTVINGAPYFTNFSGILISMSGGGSGGTANPAGSTNDVQFNSGGLLAADTGNFTYTNGLLAVPSISATSISTTVSNFASGTTFSNLVGGSGNMISSGSAVVSTSSAGSTTIYSGGSPRMLVASTGVGIGTTSPNAQLVVENNSTDYTRLRLRNTNAAGGTGYYFGTNTDNDYSAFIIANNTSNTAYAGANSMQMVNSRGPLAFFTSSNGVLERMRIDTSGNIGFGVTDPLIAPNPGVSIRPSIGMISMGHANGSANGSSYLYFNYNGSGIGSITQNGTTAVSYNTSSDRRVKEDITDTREGLQKLMSLPVRDFAFRNDPSHTIVTGFIAQELEKVFPEAVTTNGDDGETKLTSGTAPWSVDYGRITPLIVKSVQELKADNDNLRAELEELRGEVRALKQKGR